MDTSNTVSRPRPTGSAATPLNIAIACLVCGIVGLLMFSLISGPVSTGAISAGVIDAALFATMLAATTRQR